MNEQLLIGIIFAVVTSVSSYLAGFLTFGGSLAQCLLGVILLGIGGWQWTIPMLVFFIFSSLLSRLGKEQKTVASLYSEKSSRRDAWQVAANGGVAGIVTLTWFFTRNDTLYLAYLGAVAAATADTWGTEVGTIARGNPILITTFKKVEKGKSGGISLLGLVAGVLGAYVIWLSSTAWLKDLDSTKVLLSILIGGVSASMFDSLMGATLQSQYRCDICSKVTESPFHCGKRGVLISGYPAVRNDLVNFLCTLFGSFASYVSYGA